MIGIIDVGGGLRDIYGAGVFDYLLDNEIYLDCFIGVSAGSANGASYIARQKGRNKQFYTDYSLRKEAMSPYNFIKTGSYLNLQYVYGKLSAEDGEYPLDYETLKNSSTDFIIVATDSETGRARYFNKKDDMHKDDYRVIMASSCLPLVCRPIKVYTSKYFDGGISDPFPLKKAFDLGCDKVIIVLTKPIEAEVKQLRNDVVARFLRARHPALSAAIDAMTDKYTEGLTKALELQEEGKVLIVAPDDILGMKTLTRDQEKLTALYEKGYHDAEKIKDFIK